MRLRAASGFGRWGGARRRGEPPDFSRVFRGIVDISELLRESGQFLKDGNRVRVIRRFVQKLLVIGQRLFVTVQRQKSDRKSVV